MSDKTLAFLDLETTGLDPRKHEIIEWAIILRHPGQQDIETHFTTEFDFSAANPKALEVNRYELRRQDLDDLLVEASWAANFCNEHLRDTVIVGNNVQFDLRFIEQFLWDCGDPYDTTPWHYHPVDLKALVAGRLNLGAPPWSTKNIADQAQVPLPDGYHSALVDARWNRDLYDAVMNYERTYLPNGSVNPLHLRRRHTESWTESY